MKNYICCRQRLAGLVLFFLLLFYTDAFSHDTLSFEKILLNVNTALNHSDKVFHKKKNELEVRLAGVNRVIINTAGNNPEEYRAALEQKIYLLEEITALQMNMDLTKLKIRYKNGIDLIRLMYEKILGLDHHFTGLHTYQHINVLSNPHSYPSFQKTQEIIKKNKNKKYNMRLPNLLQSNPFISATYTMVSVLMGENSSKEKEKDMEEVACILDFTVRMNADLNVIRNETEYLKNANQGLKEDCEKLFQEYTKPVGYLVRLEDTRTNDDWGVLSNKLEDCTRDVESELQVKGTVTINTSRLIVDMEFATQRVIDFINKYSNFINQGTQYYQKFDSVISNYQYENSCEEELPRQFEEMKADIKSTIEKFQNTYDLPELQGSRLKDLMFGVGD
ncbi:MAG: hypothetical protein AAFZ15_27495 [Bacteroidota bacterium]